jgi:hypothetical protein
MRLTCGAARSSVRKVAAGLFTAGALMAAQTAEAAYVYEASSSITHQYMGGSGYASYSYQADSYNNGSAAVVGGPISQNFALNKTMSVTLQAPAGQQFVLHAPADAEAASLEITLNGGTSGWSPFSEYGYLYDGSISNVQFTDLVGTESPSLSPFLEYAAADAPSNAGKPKRLYGSLRVSLPVGQTVAFTSLSFDMVAPPQANDVLTFNDSPQMTLSAHATASTMADPGQWFSLAPVPEPTAIGGLAIASAGVLLRRRRTESVR